MADTNGAASRPARADGGRLPVYLIVLLFAAAVFLACIISPPGLMDDVDAVQAQISRNMLTSGDWVTARLDGVLYLEKAPLIYWLMAIAFRIFGPYDWAARIVIALSSMGTCLITAGFGRWAFGRAAGMWAGICMATCVGMFLFTRILIPDVLLAGAIALAMWAFLRVLEEEEPHPRLWAATFAACMGAGLLLKSLIGVVFPLGAAMVYLLINGQLFTRRTWRRLRPLSGTLIILAIALPWHVLAMVRNPPLFDFTMRSVPGEYHGFFWFFFINEQLLRFLNLRYPRDYNTVPRVWFWLLHFVWLFPWSVCLPAAVKLSYKPVDRAGRTRLAALCLTGFVLIFFTFSTTQEYYSMPCYPALALLIGSAMTTESKWVGRGMRVLCVVTGLAALAVFTLAFLARNQPTPGDISTALSSNPSAYTLSLGHIEDLTLKSFAYLRLPLLVAGVAFLVGFLGTLLFRGRKAFFAMAVMMVIFIQAAQLALRAFEPYMGSRTIAEALLHSPPGDLIVDHHYYTFSSIFFYTNRTALLRNGRINNLVYGSYAPGAPNVFIDDAQFRDLWTRPSRWYIVAADTALPGLTALVGEEALHVVKASGGKLLLTNLPVR